jgi:glycosyltransferase involved in cell wall biosynthesis
MSNITVIMPTFNGEKYISEQLDSIISQLISGDQLIICDDCSTDSTTNIINIYCQKFSFIIFLKNKKNRGVNFTIKKLLLNVKTEKFCFVDQDDIWLDDRLCLIRKTNNNLVIVPYCFEDSLIDFKKRGIFNVYFAFFKNSIPGCSIGGSTKIVKDLLFSNNFKSLYDYFIIVRALLSGIKFVFDNQPRFIYRRHSETFTKDGWAVNGLKYAFKIRLILVLDLYRSLKSN